MGSAFHFSLDIDRQEYLRYYEGGAKSVQVRTIQGLLIQFPAAALKPYVTHLGVRGNFVIKFDKNNKLLSLEEFGK